MHLHVYTMYSTIVHMFAQYGGHSPHVSMKSWVRISGMGVVRLNSRCSVLNFAITQNFFISS